VRVARNCSACLGCCRGIVVATICTCSVNLVISPYTRADTNSVAWRTSRVPTVAPYRNPMSVRLPRSTFAPIEPVCRSVEPHIVLSVEIGVSVCSLQPRSCIHNEIWWRCSRLTEAVKCIRRGCIEQLVSMMTTYRIVAHGLVPRTTFTVKL
jgi:hypothetical protein